MTLSIPTRLALLCLSYFAFTVFYNTHTMISVDEFWYAHRIYQYRTGLPYRDFSPYKTVLGYYLLLPAMLLTHGYFKTLYLLKNTLSLINALAFFTAGLSLCRLFNKNAVMLALIAVMASETVLSYSTQIRVDMLAYWFCLFALLGLLEKRFILAGILMGLGFLISQKVIWYWFASNLGLGLCWIITERHRPYFFQCVKYNVIILGLILAYACFWSWISSPAIVWQSLVVEASVMYHLEWYAHAKHLFWHIILTLNPFLFLLAPLTVISLITPNEADFPKRLFIVPTALTILACLIPYNQVFPYYMQVTIPAFLLLYASFFSWIITLEKTTPRSLPPTLCLLILSATCTVLIGLIVYFNLAWPYLLLLSFPVSVLVLLKSQSPSRKKNAITLMIIAAVFVGGIYPLSLFTANISRLNNAYQKANLSMARAWLSDGGDYLAGVEFFYDYSQPIAGMRHLIGPAIDYLSAPTPELRDVMTASQYEDPRATLSSVILAIKQSRVSFYLNNYRMRALPPAIQQVLHQRYYHWWGSLYTYAPLITPETRDFSLAFTAVYKVMGPAKQIQLDGKTLHRGELITLQAGQHHHDSHTRFRLQRQPPKTVPPADPQFQADQEAKLVF